MQMENNKTMFLAVSARRVTLVNNDCIRQLAQGLTDSWSIPVTMLHIVLKIILKVQADRVLNSLK